MQKITRVSARTIWLVAAAPAYVALMSAAGAADLPSAAPTYRAPVVAPVAGYNWNGFYVGGHFGYGWQDVTTDSFNSTGTFLQTTSSDRKGWLGGGQIGYNWVFVPNWIVGIEGDYSGADISGTNSGCSDTGCSLSASKTDALATVRGRLGYAWNNTLWYGTGGWAWSHSHTDRTVTCVVAGGGVCPGGPSPSALTGQTASASGSQGGWVAGGGIEWGFLPNWTAKIEYQHLQFDDVVREFTYPGFPTAFRHNVSNTSIDTVRIGVNYLFRYQ